MNISVNSPYPIQKLYVLIKPVHELYGKEILEPDVDVKVVSGLYNIKYGYSSDWLWKDNDRFVVGYELEPRYWNRDYKHVLVRERPLGFEEDFYRELIEVLKKPD
jgi:hypothetical protein